MPSINILKALYDRAVKLDVDIADVVNANLEEYLDELEKKG